MESDVNIRSGKIIIIIIIIILIIIIIIIIVIITIIMIITDSLLAFKCDANSHHRCYITSLRCVASYMKSPPLKVFTTPRS